MSVIAPHVTLRSAEPALIALPWAKPLREWVAPEVELVPLEVGPSRHLVRFVRVAGRLLAVKELPSPLVEREFAILRRLESAGMPAVIPIGAVDRGDGEGFIVTDYLRGSIQYRRLLSTPGAASSGQFSGRLLDALAVLLVDLHRHGVWWGDGSLANALLKRDGNRLQAYLVDAETAEYQEQLSEGQRRHDLEILVENVAFGLADAAAALGGSEVDTDAAVRASSALRERYVALWEQLHRPFVARASDRRAVAARIRDLNALGFAVEEMSLDVTSGEGMRVSLAIASRRFHAEQLLRLTGVDALEGQAQLLLNDLHEYGIWLQVQGEEHLALTLVAARWRAEVLEPTLLRLRPHLAPGRDVLQAYCDALEHKWILSERAGADVGLDTALTDYIARGVPAPESTRVGAESHDAVSAEDALVSAAVSAADQDASR
ncbi:MAG: DUF4032 domain-containing protein [bacterium]|nr:DUF4032 domain-containing protein [Candidatus Aquidulcis sp.]